MYNNKFVIGKHYHYNPINKLIGGGGGLKITTKREGVIFAQTFTDRRLACRKQRLVLKDTQRSARSSSRLSQKTRRNGTLPAILGERSGHSCIVNYLCLWLIRCGIFFSIAYPRPISLTTISIYSNFFPLKSWHSLYSKRFGSRCAIHLSYLLFDPVLGLWYNCFLRPPAAALISLWRLNCRMSPPLDSRHNHISYK